MQTGKFLRNGLGKQGCNGMDNGKVNTCPGKRNMLLPKRRTQGRWITNDEDFEKFLRRLKTCEEFALDTEYHNF